MSDNQIVNSNADVQEAPENGTTATTKAPVQTAHDDFDWSIDKRNVSSYNKEEKLKYDAVYENTFKTITDGEMMDGAVVALTKTDVVINIGFKSDGLISLNEFRDLPNLKIGDSVEVMVVLIFIERGSIWFLLGLVVRWIVGRFRRHPPYRRRFPIELNSQNSEYKGDRDAN